MQDPRSVRYAILSHVWSSQGEQSYQDLQSIMAEQGAAVSRNPSSAATGAPPTGSRSAPSQTTETPGPHGHTIFPVGVSNKIRRCCTYALQEGYRYVWIDSCCIDKSSSAELTEAINSMFKWYQLASICYVYLEDVGSFTRGWTLQELIAPSVVFFFLSMEWIPLGTKDTLSAIIEHITGIDWAILVHRESLGSVSVARRLSWASGRKTSREEDEAYSLLGIFGVHMPTIYGEGYNACIRLQ
ncbi:hypothetical protein BV20DRAFT_1064414 [Pilatotrama ljubarskyi]|nr:hypothetical protein BV20DRAFT_1064414 [Pilatotrama ljubarskyi]